MHPLKNQYVKFKWLQLYFLDDALTAVTAGPRRAAAAAAGGVKKKKRRQAWNFGHVGTSAPLLQVMMVWAWLTQLCAAHSSTAWWPDLAWPRLAWPGPHT